MSLATASCIGICHDCPAARATLDLHAMSAVRSGATKGNYSEHPSRHAAIGETTKTMHLCEFCPNAALRGRRAPIAARRRGPDIRMSCSKADQRAVQLMLTNQRVYRRRPIEGLRLANMEMLQHPKRWPFRPLAAHGEDAGCSRLKFVAGRAHKSGNSCNSVVAAGCRCLSAARRAGRWHAGRQVCASSFGPAAWTGLWRQMPAAPAMQP